MIPERKHMQLRDDTLLGLHLCNETLTGFKSLEYFEGKAAAVFGASKSENPYIGKTDPAEYTREAIDWDAGFEAAHKRVIA